MTEPRLTIDDCRKAGYCVAGIMRFTGQFGVDFKEFVLRGVPLADAEAVDNALVQRAVEIARRRLGDADG